MMGTTGLRRERRRRAGLVLLAVLAAALLPVAAARMSRVETSSSPSSTAQSSNASSRGAGEPNRAPEPSSVSSSNATSSSTPPLRRRFSVTTYPMRGPCVWDNLSPSVQRDFTLNGRVPVERVYFHEQGVGGGEYQILWPQRMLERAVVSARRREDLAELGGYTGATAALYRTVDRHPVRGKRALVVGSTSPWVEAILVANGALVTTVDFIKPTSALPHLFRTLSIEELETLDEPPFDLLVSYSSLEHDGLGRYGDPINPNADLERMRLLRELVQPGGLFFLGVPVGPDVVVFNGGRIYGPIRLPMLLDGWKWIDTTPDLATPPEGPLAYNVYADWTHQPWLILQRPRSPV